MEALKEHFPRGVDAIIEGYAPYWMNLGQATFVKTLQRIHPDHVRDIWNTRHEAAGAPSVHPVAPVVPELVDYYCDLMELSCAPAYAYVPVLFDLSHYSRLASNRRWNRTRQLKGRRHSYNGLRPALLHDMEVTRSRGLSGRDANKQPLYNGGYSRLNVPSRQEPERDPQFLYH